MERERQLKEQEERGRRDGTHGDCRGSKGKEKEAKPFLASKLFESQEERGKMSYIVPGAGTLPSLFLIKPDRTVRKQPQQHSRKTGTELQVGLLV